MDFQVFYTDPFLIKGLAFLSCTEHEYENGSCSKVMNGLIDCPETIAQIAMSLERCESQFEEAFLDETALYRCFNNQDELLYIGISYSATNRISQHKTRSMWAKYVVAIHIEHFGSRAKALIAEGIAIRAEYPKFNKQQNNGERPYQLGHSTICSFKHAATINNGNILNGLRISGSPYIHEPDLITGRIHDRNINIGQNAWELRKMFCFKPWEDKILEIEIETLFNLFGFEYRFEYIEDFRRYVIDPALKMIEDTISEANALEDAISVIDGTVKKNVYCSGEHLTCTAKKAWGCVTHLVFVNNKEPIKPPTYLEVLADKRGIDREEFKTYARVRRMLPPD